MISKTLLPVSATSSKWRTYCPSKGHKKSILRQFFPSEHRQGCAKNRCRVHGPWARKSLKQSGANYYVVSMVWTQLHHCLIAIKCSMARKFRLSFSKRVAGLRISFIFSEKTSHNVAHGIEIWVMRDRGFGVGFRRNYRQCAFVSDLLPDRFAAIRFVQGLVG